MSLWSSIANTSVARIFSLLTSLGTLSLTAWVLGPDGRGIIATTTTWVGVVATMASLSLGHVALHRAANASGSTWLPDLLRVLSVTSIGLSILCWLALYTIWLVKPELFGALPDWALLMGLLAIPFYVWETYGSQLLVASGNLRFYNRRLLWYSGVGFLAVLALLLLFNGGVASTLAILLGAAAANSAAGYCKLRKIAPEPVSSGSLGVWALLKDGLKLHLNAVGGVMIIGMDVLMLNYYRHPAEVGQYQLAAQLISAMLIIPLSAGMVFNQLMGREGVNAIWGRQLRMIIVVMALMLLGASVFYLVAPYLIKFVAGPGFERSAELVRIMLFCIPGMTLSLCMANQWLGRGLFMLAAFTTLLSGVMNFALNLYLIPRLGATGAAWATVTVYGFGILFNIGMMIYVHNRASSIMKKCVP